MKIRLLALALVVVGATAATAQAQVLYETHHGRSARRRAATYAWHGDYYYTQWGRPVALVVPPTAELQTNYGWGVGNTRVTRIDHQFQRPYPGYGFEGSPFAPTPVIPSDTNQFGVYYIRGPW
jgi:hypothetical protein